MSDAPAPPAASGWRRLLPVGAGSIQSKLLLMLLLTSSVRATD